ncbi:MAG: type II CAAX endopeptidase family protein [Vallitaleaceae bacterium]|jgi:membrane protease YdiL (CAAX protease family)|nr:type II CAAX endopeptidase family protein [Vallitaleaceae bacterium]
MNSVNRGHIYMLIIMLYMLAAQILMGIIINATGIELSFTANALISQYVLILLPAIIYFIITKSSIKNTLKFKKTTWTNIFLAIGIGIFIQPLMNLINLISQLFVTNYIGSYVKDMMSMPFLLLLFLLAVTPALVEEITFRGIILSNFKHQSVLVACLINGLFFGIFHGNINQFLYAFVLGVVFCYLVHLTGSIIPAMVAHFVINASSLTMQKIMVILTNLFIPENSAILETAANPDSSDILVASLLVLFMVIVTLPIVLLLIRQMHRHNNKPNFIKNKAISGVLLGDISSDEVNPEGETSHEKVITPVFILIVVYFILYTALFEFIIPALTVAN